jgi:hypothetical protein
MSSLIVVLRLSVSPPTFSRFVIAKRVNPIQGHSVWTPTHIGKEFFKRLSPLVTHIYASSPVTLERLIALGSAPLLCSIP